MFPFRDENPQLAVPLVTCAIIGVIHTVPGTRNGTRRRLAQDRRPTSLMV